MGPFFWRWEPSHVLIITWGCSWTCLKSSEPVGHWHNVLPCTSPEHGLNTLPRGSGKGGRGTRLSATVSSVSETAVSSCRDRSVCPSCCSAEIPTRSRESPARAFNLVPSVVIQKVTFLIIRWWCSAVPEAQTQCFRPPQRCICIPGGAPKSWVWQVYAR